MGYRGRTKVWTRGAPRPPCPKPATALSESGVHLATSQHRKARIQEPESPGRLKQLQKTPFSTRTPPPPAAQGPFRAARSLGPCARGFGAGGAHTDLKATRPQGQTSPWQSQKSKPRAPQTQEPDKTFRAESFQGENFIGHGGRGAPLVQTWCATPVPQTLFCLTTAILKSKRPPRACPKADPREIRGTLCEPKTQI